MSETVPPAPSDNKTHGVRLLNPLRWKWFTAVAGFSTLVLAALVVFVPFTWWRVLVFGWLPLMLVEFFAATYAGGAKERRRWLSFITLSLAGLTVSVWLVFLEDQTWWKILVFGTVPFTALVLWLTVFMKRRVAPFRVVQVISAVLLNAYVLAYLQQKILYSGFFKYVPQPVLNCYGGPLAVFACPIGSTQQMIGMKWLPWLTLGVFIVIGALVGRAACAWLCPFGMWQDLLRKLPVGHRKRTKRWAAFAAVAAVALAISVALIVWLHLPWMYVLILAWLPFVGLLLLFVLRGRLDVPKRMWLGGFLAAVGLGALVWLRFGYGYGVAAGFFGMLLLGLTGRWVAAAIAAVAGALLASWGGGFAVGPLSGVGLGLAVGAAAFGLVALLDSALRVSLPSHFLKYGILMLVAGLASYLTVEPWFCKLCPQGTLGAGIPLVLWDPVSALRGMVGWLYWVKVGFLLLVVVLSIGIKRPFCRLVCPIGAVYSVFNKLSLLRLETRPSECRTCGLCQRVCPMNISVYDNANQLECIRCMECVWNCGPNGVRIKV